MTAAPAPPARHALMIHPRCDNGPLRVHSFISWESFMRKLAAILALSLVASSANADDSVTDFVASDKRTQITVPGGWGAMELNDAAEIQVGNAAEEAYLIVLNERKEDLYGWNLDKHSRVTLGRLLTGVASPTVKGPVSLTIGGSPAVQYEIRGAAENRNIVYLHTTVDGPKHFSQILAWTLPSKSGVVIPRLRQAISTFRELP